MACLCPSRSSAPSDMEASSLRLLEALSWHSWWSQHTVEGTTADAVLRQAFRVCLTQLQRWHATKSSHGSVSGLVMAAGRQGHEDIREGGGSDLGAGAQPAR